MTLRRLRLDRHQCNRRQENPERFHFFCPIGNAAAKPVSRLSRRASARSISTDRNGDKNNIWGGQREPHERERVTRYSSGSESSNLAGMPNSPAFRAEDRAPY